MWRDSRSGYGLISIGFHWIGAALVIAIWLIGNQIGGAPHGPERSAVEGLHFSVGVLSMIVLFPRLIWRAINYRTPLVATSAPWLDVVAKVVKWALLASILVMLVTGPLDVWGGGRAINVFGFAIPSPLPSSIGESLHHYVGRIHRITSKIIFVLVALHILGALKHLVIDRDGVLKRMLMPAKQSL